MEQCGTDKLLLAASKRATLPLCPECRCLLVLSKELPSRSYSQSATARFTLGESATVLLRLSTARDGITSASRVMPRLFLTTDRESRYPSARQNLSCLTLLMHYGHFKLSSQYPQVLQGVRRCHGDACRHQFSLRERG
jgi:hypothetical protein